MTPKIDEYGRVAKSGNAAIEDPHDRMLSKLSKLLEVKNRAATEAEAATAAALLARFLLEHNLSIADIEKKGQAAPGVTEGAHDLGKAAFKWKLNLAEGIARFYYCEPLVDRQTKRVAFVGRPDNVEALTMLYGWVIDQIKAIATTERRIHFDTTGEHIDPLRWQLGFGEGAVERLIERMKEMKARQDEEMSRDQYGTVTALAVHHSSEASDYLEVKYGYRKDGKRTKKEQDSIDRWQREREDRDSLKVLCESHAGDDNIVHVEGCHNLCIESDKYGEPCDCHMEPYYAKYPWDRPDTPEEIAAREKRNAEYEKRAARNARRRTGGGGYREKKIDWDKEEQSEKAATSGRKAADRINVQPFIGGQTDRKKVG